MLGRRAFYGRDRRQEVSDLVQEVMVALLEHDARLLRAWDEGRGLSLENFVGLVCEREVASILRSGRRMPYRSPEEDINDYDQLPDTQPSVDAALMSQDMVIAILDEARTSLSHLGLEMLERIILAQEAPEKIAHEMNMSPDAVYAWRSRLSKLLRTIALRLDPKSSSTLKVVSPQSEKPHD